MPHDTNGDWRSRVKDAYQIGPFLKRRRLELGLPKTGPRGAQKVIGVSKPTYHAWEEGHWPPRLDKARRIADFLDVPLSDVITVLVRMGADVPDYQRMEFMDAGARDVERRVVEDTERRLRLRQEADEIERKLLGRMPKTQPPEEGSG